MILIYAKLEDVCKSLKVFQDLLSDHLVGSKKTLMDIYFTPLEMLECPQVRLLEDDMDKLQGQGNETLNDIQELIAGIHKAINEFQDAEQKTAFEINEAMASNSLFLSGAGNLANTGVNKSGIAVAKGTSNPSSEDTNMLDTALQCGKELGEHPLDTGMAVVGVGLGVLGVIGSGALTYFTAGTATPVSAPVALFSVNSVVTSTSNLIYIASGNYKKQGNVNILKGGTELAGGLVGEGGDVVAHNFGYKTNYEEKGRGFGGVAFEGVNFFMGARGVSKGVGTIANKAYHLKVIENAGGRIVPNITVAVNEISKVKKIGAGVSIANTSASWTKKVISECNKK